MTPTLSTLRVPSSSPRRLHDALRVLGLNLTLRQCRELDRDYLLHDVKIIFRRKIATVHPDHGGDAATARTIVEAYKVVRRLCAPRVFIMRKPTLYVKRGPKVWTKEELESRNRKAAKTKRERREAKKGKGE